MTRVRGWIDRARRRWRPDPPPAAALVHERDPEVLGWILARIERMRAEPASARDLADDCSAYLATLDPPLLIQPDALARLMLFVGRTDDEMFRMMLRFLVVMEEKDARRLQARALP